MTHTRDSNVLYGNKIIPTRVRFLRKPNTISTTPFSTERDGCEHLRGDYVPNGVMKSKNSGTPN